MEQSGMLSFPISDILSANLNRRALSTIPSPGTSRR